MRRLSTVIPFGFEFDPARYLRAYRSLGCGSAQFYRNLNKPPTVAEANALVRDAGMRFDSMHAAFGELIDPSSPDGAQRAQCLRLYDDEAQLARDLGCDMAVVHPAANLPGYRTLNADEANALQEQRWAYLDDFLKRLADIGERRSVTFLIENLPRMFYLGHDPIALARRVLAIGSPRLRMCFDTGHAHMVGDVPTLIEACAPAIAYLHLHDNNAKDDNHRMIGDGTINWAAAARAIRGAKLDVYCMLEVFYPEGEIESLAAAGLGARVAAACAIGD